MGFETNEDNMMIKCSPIRTIKGTETFLANISVIDDIGAKFCGVQMPQYHISYNDGFSDDELAGVLERVKGLESELLEQAKNATVPEDAPEGDIEILD